MNPATIRYLARRCDDPQRIDRLLSSARTGVLGVGGDEFPYAVPVNFVWHDGSVYFHGMGTGKKNTLLSRHPSACFTVYHDDGTVDDPVPCRMDTAYLSVMLFGTVTTVDDPHERATVLQQVVEKYAPGAPVPPVTARTAAGYRSGVDGAVMAVHRLTPVHVTAKENRRDEP